MRLCGAGCGSWAEGPLHTPGQVPQGQTGVAAFPASTPLLALRDAMQPRDTASVLQHNIFKHLGPPSLQHTAEGLAW